MNENFKNISSQKHLLSELANPKSKYRTSILKKAQPQLVLAICESVYNILEGKLPLDKEKKESLMKYKHILRKLVQKNNLKYKKKNTGTKRWIFKYYPANCFRINLNYF
jgi:hypothetical protein